MSQELDPSTIAKISKDAPAAAVIEQGSRPSSTRKLDSSRSNGAHSHGPTTPESQQKCAIAAATQINHGMLAKAVVLPGDSEARFREMARQDPADADAPAPFRATLAFRSLCQDEGHSQALAHRYETTYERQYNRALRDLALLRDLSPKSRRSENMSPAAFSHGANWADEEQQPQQQQQKEAA